MWVFNYDFKKYVKILLYLIRILKYPSKSFGIKKSNDFGGFYLLVNSKVLNIDTNSIKKSSHLGRY